MASHPNRAKEKSRGGHLKNLLRQRFQIVICLLFWLPSSPLLQLAYVSWTVARLIVGATEAPIAGVRLLTLPLVASFVMTAWDFAQDPVWSTMLHAWRWRDGGVWLGVPPTNFAGWLLTVFLIYSAFAWYLRLSPDVRPAPALPHFDAAILFYVLCAGGNALQMLRPQPASIVADPSGRLWHTRRSFRVRRWFQFL